MLRLQRVRYLSQIIQFHPILSSNSSLFHLSFRQYLGKNNHKLFKSFLSNIPYHYENENDHQIDRLKQYLIQDKMDIFNSFTEKELLDVDYLFHNQFNSSDDATLLFLIANKLEDDVLIFKLYNALEKTQISPPMVILSITTAACRRLGNVKVGLKIWKRMKKSYFHHHDIYENILFTCSQENRWLSCINLIEEMQQLNYFPSLLCYQETLKTCIHNKEWTAFDQMYQKTLLSYPHEIFSINLSIINYLLDYQHSKQAYQYYQKLKKKKLINSSDIIFQKKIYIRLLNELFLQSEYDTMDEILKSSLDFNSFNDINHELLYEKVYRLMFYLYENKNFPITTDHLNQYFKTLSISSCEEKSKKANEMYQSMFRKDIKKLNLLPNILTFYYCIQCCEEPKKFQLALYFYDQIIIKELLNEKEKKIYAKIIDKLIYLCYERKSFKKCIQMYENVSNVMDLSNSTLIKMLHVYYETKKNEKTIALFTQLKQNNIELDPSLYELPMSSYLNLNQSHIVPILLNTMLEAEILPTLECFYYAMKACAIERDDSTALFLYTQMMKQNILIDTKTIVELIKATNPTSPQLFMYLYRTFTSFQLCTHSTSILNSFLLSVINEKKIQTMIDILNHSPHMKWNTMTYSLVMRGYLMNDQVEKVDLLFNEMKKKKIPISKYTFHELLKSIKYKEENNDSMMVLKKIKRIIKKMNLLKHEFDYRAMIILIDLYIRYQKQDLYEYIFQFLEKYPKMIDILLFEKMMIASSTQSNDRIIFIYYHFINQMSNEQANIAIQKLCIACFKSQQTHLLSTLMPYLIHSPIPFNTKTWDQLIHTIILTQDINALKLFFHETTQTKNLWKVNQITLSEISWNNILKLLMKKDEFIEIQKILKCISSTNSISSLVKYIEKNPHERKQWKKIRHKLLEMMESSFLENDLGAVANGNGPTK